MCALFNTFKTSVFYLLELKKDGGLGGVTKSLVAKKPSNLVPLHSRAVMTKKGCLKDPRGRVNRGRLNPVVPVITTKVVAFCRTPCTHIFVCHAHRSTRPRTPCIDTSACHARRSTRPRTPCIDASACHARRSTRPHTPCIHSFACHAHISSAF